ncbi:MAG: hypothetical protein ABW076_17820 [Candidatus Thiodiazotropha sp.]
MKPIFTRPSFMKNLTASSVAILCALASPLTSADDIEIYLQEPPDPVPPNVLFVLDESGSMDTRDATLANGNRATRRDALVEAMHIIFDQDEMQNVNSAMMGYTTASGNNGPLRFVAHTGDFQVVADDPGLFQTRIDALRTLSYTPTVKALESAVAWFRNDQTFTDYYGNTMTSPIDGSGEDNWCKPNHIVLLSDGEPNSNDPNSGGRYGLTSYEGTNCASDWTSVYQNGRCAREIADWAFTTDLETTAGWDEQQNIITHTIGFSTGSQATAFLTDIAAHGGGGYYPASNSADLVDAFTSIITGAQESIPYAYTAPVIPFNPDNAAISGNRIFIPLIVPSGDTFWKGNLKGYTISITAAGDIVLQDANGGNVVNTSYEFISSRDLWSSSTDGGDTLTNGAAAHMGAGGASRALFSNIDPDAPLSSNVNRVVNSNNNLTNEMLSVGSDDDRLDLINWVTWSWNEPIPNPNEEETHEGVMGAPIHTQPVVVSYASGDIIYLPTSEGVLEAIDAETGVELWAFMPTDLLGNIITLKTNNPSTIPYYGLDGPLTYYELGSRKMLIFGMRRGGKKYYLLDVTDPAEPLFVKDISAEADSEYAGLAQTWSKPLYVRMDIGGSVRDVLVFGGGYDRDQDNATTRSPDDEGNFIFIANAADGELIRSISGSGADLNIPNMTNGIASDIMTLDIDGDGLVDRLYASDVGGRVIRVDIAGLSGGVIADVSTTQFRKFFNTPQLGYYSKGGSQFFAILIGSGDRTDPLDTTVTDRFYMIKDLAVWGPPSSYETVTESDMEDASSSVASRDTVLSPGSGGWYFDLAATEKSYSKAILYNYAVIFTTFSATREDTLGVCEARGASGTARIYAVDLVDANAKFSWHGGDESNLTVADRSDTLNMLGIPPTPTLVFPGETDDQGNEVIGRTVHLLVGIEEKREWSDRFLPLYWEEVIEDE